MKKVFVGKRLWIVLFVFLPFMAFISFDWVTTSIDERASVDFPAAPDKQDVQGNAVLTANGDKSKYVAVAFDFGKFGADSAMMAAELDKPEMMDQVKNGIMGELKGSTLVSEKDTLTNGYRTFEFIFDIPESDSVGLNRMHSKTVFVAAKMYSLSFIEDKDAPKEADRRKFFNSLKIK
ncbi:MAG TPA: hypothetical protein VHM26_14455 [Chitinophagaceae bacterium]|jgi:hypothetical protein|nr:hypothetical protein [Chitinophagaceae bacterium]